MNGPRDRDQTLTCADCQGEFAFTADEQGFYRERGFRPPTRCAACRAQRRADRNADLIATHDAGSTLTVGTDHGSYGGLTIGRSAASSNRRFAGGGPRSLFAAVCAECGADTQVPFEPRGGRPVYCRACFNARRGR